MFFFRKKFRFVMEKNPKARNIMFLVLFCLGFTVGFLIEWRVSVSREENAVFDFRKIHPINENYKFISPLLGFDSSEKAYSEYVSLEKDVQTFIDKPDISKKLDKISVYFRNLETGQWVGINENDEFNPASLLKVPVMILYFKLAESDPGILKRTYFYTEKDLNLLKSVSGGDDSTAMIPDKPYTVEELIREMIIRSDNVAKYLLILHSPENDLKNIYGNLGVQISGRDQYRISTKTYSLFFRTLYNGTFLNYEMSEKALKLLSEAEFKNGLIAGVPSDVKVAHKYGRYATVENGRAINVEAHDCGIVYYPDSPYLLCVMTRGYDTDQLEDIIQKISKLTYDFLKENKIKQ